MIKKTIAFSKPYHLSTELQQLVITNKDSGEIIKRPIEDIGYVIFEHPHITFTQSVMQRFSANNAAVIFCNEKYLPTSMLFHLDTNQVQTERFRAQVNAGEPLKKQLWQQTVKAKIRNQARLLKFSGNSDQALLRIATQVKSGDSSNEEAQAARHYWHYLFGEGFTRERFGIPPNAALNYGYAILRAAVARGLSGSGLLPTLGIHHRNKYNAYCLADDIMEPYRPLVDQTVWQLYHSGSDCSDIGKEVKQQLLSTLTCDVTIGGKTRPLTLAISETTASLARCFTGESKKVIYGTFFE